MRMPRSSTELETGHDCLPVGFSIHRHSSTIHRSKSDLESKAGHAHFPGPYFAFLPFPDGIRRLETIIACHGDDDSGRRSREGICPRGHLYRGWCFGRIDRARGSCPCSSITVITSKAIDIICNLTSSIHSRIGEIIWQMCACLSVLHTDGHGREIRAKSRSGRFLGPSSEIPSKRRQMSHSQNPSLQSPVCLHCE